MTRPPDGVGKVTRRSRRGPRPTDPEMSRSAAGRPSRECSTTSTGGSTAPAKLESLDHDPPGGGPEDARRCAGHRPDEGVRLREIEVDGHREIHLNAPWRPTVEVVETDLGDTSSSWPTRCRRTSSPRGAQDRAPVARCSRVPGTRCPTTAPLCASPGSGCEQVPGRRHGITGVTSPPSTPPLVLVTTRARPHVHVAAPPACAVMPWEGHPPLRGPRRAGPAADRSANRQRLSTYLSMMTPPRPARSTPNAST